MKPNKDIPKMEPFFSTEDRMKIIFSIISLFKVNKHGPIKFMDLYTLSNGELHTLHKVLTDLSPTVIETEEDINIWNDETFGTAPLRMRYEDDSIPF